MTIDRKSALLTSGMVAVIVYVLHVLIGGILWKGYSHLQQPISDLTATGAPNRALLLSLTAIYGVLAIIFALTFTFSEGKKHHKLVFWGGVFFSILHFVSILYNFFPEDLSPTVATVSGTMHIVLTALIVPFTILTPFLIGFGFLKEKNWRDLGYISILTGCLILVFGSLTAIYYANKWPYFGLVERINIGVLQAWTFYFSFKLFTRE